MSFIGFIKDKNGNYFSENRKIRYIMLAGEELIKFLKDTKGESRYFHMEIDDDGNRYVFETDRERALKMRRELDHIRYKERCEKGFGYQIVSANSICDRCETETELIETISYEDDIGTEDLAFRSMSRKVVRDILKELNDDEYSLVYWLYLAPNRISLKKYAALNKIPRTTVQDKKRKILDKIKNILDKIS